MSLTYTYEELELNTASRSGHVALNIDKNHVMVIGGRKDRVTEIHPFQMNENSSLVKHSLAALFESLISEKNSELKSLKNTSNFGRRFFAAVKTGESKSSFKSRTFL